MSNADGNHTTPAGWYPDPAGSPQLRWWDGSAWTDHLQAAAPEPAPAAPVAPSSSLQAPAYGQGYSAAPAYAVSGYPSVPAGTPAYGPFIWVITLLPLISFLMIPLLYPSLELQLRSSMAGPYGQHLYGGYSMSGLVIQGVVNLISLALYAATVVLAYFDHRWLLRAGYVRPFHWAWAFLNPVYPIGRSVVVRRRSGRGIAPMWVSIAIAAVGVIVAIVLIVVVFSYTFSMMSSAGYGNLS
ncbi:DUF2510 domain-containing protein [Herbiconiux ginsengi]|uniref:DUF2510 domain-containing protein n=1 Tax=Herbiconiux ginsengi TaxID=381665 RepID=A0A1H3L321_9MICO|nr:DUF2510 domain-containing protein [Herbiconiux ginsengi]SDY58275.1 Protein of unknown function [Herbiconiux ginsengi]